MPTCDLNLLRIILFRFIGTCITSTIFTRRSTFSDWHFAVAQKDYRVVMGLVNMFNCRRHLTAINRHRRAAENLLLLLLRVHTDFHVMTTRITIIHISFIMRATSKALLVKRRIFEWISATVWPKLAATRCATTVSNEMINLREMFHVQNVLCVREAKFNYIIHRDTKIIVNIFL